MPEAIQLVASYLPATLSIEISSGFAIAILAGLWIWRK